MFLLVARGPLQTKWRDIQPAEPGLAHHAAQEPLQVRDNFLELFLRVYK